MAKIDKFLTHLFKVEGGISNDKCDKGLTKWGITETTYKYYYPDTSKQLLSMTYDEAVHIYKVGYWDKMRADEIKNQSLANIMVDLLVNSGVGKIKVIQQLLIDKFNRTEVIADGIVGKVTLGVINSINPQLLFAELKNYRREYYARIAKGKSLKFLNGWLNRLSEYQFYV